MGDPMKDNSIEINYYATWTLREIERARDEVHAEIGATLIGGLTMTSPERNARLAQLKRQRASLESALEAKWKEGAR